MEVGVVLDACPPAGAVCMGLSTSCRKSSVFNVLRMLGSLKGGGGGGLAGAPIRTALAP